MESGQEGSSFVGRRKPKKSDKGRRIWTPREEEALMLAMKHVVARRLKSDNGFMAGHMKIVEEEFKNHLPKTDLKEPFAEDRATGECAEDVDAVNELKREYAAIDLDYTPCAYHVHLDDLIEADQTEGSVCPPQGCTKPSTMKKRKSSNDSIDTVCATLNEISRTTNDKLQALSMRVGYDQEMGKARMEIYPSLEAVPCLSMDKKLMICDMLAVNV